jgi:DNA-directed RNA polymerase specialized sigma24 family protein
MNERDWLTERFEQHRPHLRGVAYRMLGSVSESDDALQVASASPVVSSQSVSETT